MATKQDSNTGGLVKPQELAAMLGVGSKTIYKRIADGLIPKAVTAVTSDPRIEPLVARALRERATYEQVAEVAKAIERFEDEETIIAIWRGKPAKVIDLPPTKKSKGGAS